MIEIETATKDKTKITSQRDHTINAESLDTSKGTADKVRIITIIMAIIEIITTNEITKTPK